MGLGHHLSLSLTGEMWNDILRSALPVRIVDGEFDLASGARSVLGQLEVKRRVTHLLEDQRTPAPVAAAGRRLRDLWRDQRGRVYDRLQQLVRVEGEWNVEVDDIGTEVTYGQQRVDADAWLKATASGHITFLADNVTVPFTIEKRVGASVGLNRIRYSSEQEAVIGNLQDLALHLGDGTVLQLMSRLIEYGLEQQAPLAEPVQILKRDQIAGLVAPLGGSLQLEMGVDDLQLDVNDDEMTLKVRFGVTRATPDRQIGAKGRGQNAG